MRRVLRGAVAALVLAVLAAAPTSPVAAGGRHHPPPEASLLADFGTGFGGGSTVGPDGALYATDVATGSILRVDPDSGDVAVWATGLPTQGAGLSGPVDVVFRGWTAYALVTLVGGEIVGGPSLGDDANGIYELQRDGSFELLSDIGAWSAANPPDTGYFLTDGVQYSIEVFRGDFLVADGHHNRVLRVDRRSGAISELLTLGNVVPTGLEVRGRHVLVSLAGPVPHEPEAGRILEIDPRTSTATDIGGGTRLLVDVEYGRASRLFALSQGVWDGTAEGNPAFPDTGSLVEVLDDGTTVPVVDGSGATIVLDRPTSLDIIGDAAYVTTLTGTVVRIDHLTGRGRH